MENKGKLSINKTKILLGLERIENKRVCPKQDKRGCPATFYSGSVVKTKFKGFLSEP